MQLLLQGEQASAVCQELAKDSMYPSSSQVQNAVIKFLGCSTLEAAHKTHSLRDVTLLMSTVGCLTILVTTLHLHTEILIEPICHKSKSMSKV